MPRQLPRSINSVRATRFIILSGLVSLLALSLVLSGLLQPAAHAATTFTVNTLGDGADSNLADDVCNDGGGKCTLRAAIQQANATGGASTINVSPLGTITLTSALPAIATDMAIGGTGARQVAVSGARAFRVFNVNSGVTVTISGLTISGGSASFGAGINNGGGNLTISNCAVTNNVSTGNGGGINNNGGGTLKVLDSTIAYNSANSSGGLFNSGNATLTNTTVSSNTSATAAGGIQSVGTITLSSVTVYRNTAKGIGGGVYNPGIGSLNFANTIIAGNSGDPSAPDCSGANFVSQDYNLVESTAGCGIGGNTAHNITGVSPALGPLQENGGPTLTHAPLPGSVAVDQGNSALTTDQRGRARPADSASVANAAGGNGSDIGAVEIQAAELLSVNSLADTDDGLCDAQNCTLREAINAANAAADYNAIYLTAPGTINLSGALPDIATDMTVEGPGAKLLAVSRATGGIYRIFNVAAGVTARISGLTITGGDAGDGNGGGGISNRGTLTLTGVEVKANNAFGGGGLYNNGGTLYLVNSTLSGNTAGFGSGGGVFNGGTLYVQNSTVSDNSVSSGSGGGIFNIGGPAFVTNSTVSNNVNRGIVNVSSSSAVTLAGSIVANNQSTFPGETDLGGSGAGFVSNGYNLIRTPAPNGIVEASNPGTDIYNQDPKLGPLADWGGPTRMRGLLPDSPAIDKGKSFAADFYANPAPADQRGVARPFDFTSIAPAAGGDNSDIGAFELSPAAEAVTSKATNEDSVFSFNFFVGDQAVTTVSATSSDQTLVPNSNISITSAGASTEREIRITPAANQYGSATITVTVNGSAEGTVTRTFRLTVNPVNDAPSFTKGGDQTVPEDAGPQTVANWATGISAGPNEPSQTVSFVIDGNSNPALFSAGPSISPNGTLTYTPAPDANGTAVVTAVLKDSGGTLIGGQDTSAAQTFSITVTPVNDAPVAAGQNVSADEDTPKTITLVATDVEGDALTFQIVSGPSHGTLTGSGAGRTYTPAADFNGADSFTFKAVDINGAESNVATVNINVAAVNDAPVNSVSGAQVTRRDTPLVFSAADGNAIFVSDVDAGGSPVRVTLAATNGTVTLSGTSGLSFVSGDGTDDATVTFTASIPNVNAALAGLTFRPTAGFDGAASLQLTTDDQGASGSGGAKSDTDTILITVARSTFEFSQASYAVAEGAGSLAVTVRRAGDTSQAASVEYATDDGTNDSAPPPCAAVTGLALDRCDFTRALGTLRFAAGETEKSFLVLISDDSYTEGPETAHVTLTAAGGAAVLGSRSRASFEITDDASEPSANPIDDSTKFVRQHYHDFLNREPDAPGLAFWTNEIEKCGADAQCREVRRINVSAAFFLSIEFQETGYFVERMYKAAYGDATSPGVTGTVPVIRFNEFLVDTQEIGRGIVVGVGDWENQLEANKQAFALGFVQRPRFTAEYPSTMTAAQFVDKLAQNAGLTLTQSERDQFIEILGSTPSDTSKRAQVLRAITDAPRLREAELNRAFVLMQYYGYLRRNPDDAPDADFRGWRFWLSKLEQFHGNFVRAEMVKAFITSDEYRKRFGR